MMVTCRPSPSTPLRCSTTSLRKMLCCMPDGVVPSWKRDSIVNPVQIRTLGMTSRCTLRAIASNMRCGFGWCGLSSLMGSNEEDVLAVLKRCYHILLTDRRAYFRPPSATRIPVKVIEYEPSPQEANLLNQARIQEKYSAYKAGDMTPPPELAEDRLLVGEIHRGLHGSTPGSNSQTGFKIIDVRQCPHRSAVRPGKVQESHGDIHKDIISCFNHQGRRRQGEGWGIARWVKEGQKRGCWGGAMWWGGVSKLPHPFPWTQTHTYTHTHTHAFPLFVNHACWGLLRKPRRQDGPAHAPKRMREFGGQCFFFLGGWGDGVGCLWGSGINMLVQLHDFFFCKFFSWSFVSSIFIHLSIIFSLITHADECCGRPGDRMVLRLKNLGAWGPVGVVSASRTGSMSSRKFAFISWLLSSLLSHIWHQSHRHVSAGAWDWMVIFCRVYARR